MVLAGGRAEEDGLRFPWRTRLRLAVRARRARWSGAEPNRIFPRRYDEGFSRYFVENAYEFGALVSRRVAESEALKALQALGRGENPAQYVHLRGALPRRIQPWGFSARIAFADANPDGRGRSTVFEQPMWFVRSGHLDVVAAALINAAGAELRRKNPIDHEVWQDYVTDFAGDISLFRDGRDLWRRFRQATPEFAPNDVRADKVSASLLLVGCIENTVREPIHILPAAAVLSRLDADTLAELRKKQFEFVDGWARDLSETGRNIKCIVGGGGADPAGWWLAFDPNRIDLQSDRTSPEGREAVGRLVAQIDIVANQARPVILRRGDALLVNNWHALTRRQERNRFVLTWPWPPLRWLRVYYGFPPSLGGTVQDHPRRP